MEQELIDALTNPGVSRERLAALLQDLPSDARFEHAEPWLRLAQSGTLSDWRRLVAYYVLVRHTLSYPLPFEDFEAAAITPLGVAREAVTPQPLVQNVPLEHTLGQSIYRVYLPYQTATGPSALYFAEDRTTKLVQDANVSPSPLHLLP
jgi:hypothetical protein